MSTEKTRVTEEAAKFVWDLTYTALPPEAVRIGKRCVLDGLGLILAGSFEKCTRILVQFSESTGQPGKSSVLGRQSHETDRPLCGPDQWNCRACHGLGRQPAFNCS